MKLFKVEVIGLKKGQKEHVLHCIHKLFKKENLSNKVVIITVLTKREELSFLRVLAFPKARTKRKAFWELKQQKQNRHERKGI